LSNHSNGPEEHDEGKPDGGADALHHYVGRDLGGDVEWKKNCEAVIVLKATEVKIAFEVIEAGVTDVGAVEEA
jgi:hypothetical protein